MQTRFLRYPLTTLVAVGILVGLLVALTSAAAVAAPPLIGLDDGKGQVIGLDQPDQVTTPTTLDPRIVVGQCSPSDCTAPSTATALAREHVRTVTSADAWTSKLAGFNQIGLLPN